MPIVVLQVLPLEGLLRDCWDAGRFTKAVEQQGSTSNDKTTHFSPEATSKATIKLICQLMGSDYSWACIALVALLSKEAETVSEWSEGCPCPEHQWHAPTKEPGKKKINDIPQGASTCPFKCCRAHELACGVAMIRQDEHANQNRLLFNEYVSKAPQVKKSELHNSWSVATSKIWGFFAAFSGVT